MNEMNKEKLISEFTEKMMEIYVDRDTYSRGKIIDLAKQIFADVINKNCNLQNVSNNEVAVSCRSCKWVNADYDYKCADCGDLQNWEKETDC